LIRIAITAGASRVASDPLCLHAVAITPAGPMKRVRSYSFIVFGLPQTSGRVGSCILRFGACAAFTFFTACTLAESPEAILSIEGSGSIIASAAAPIATGWSEPVPGWDFHPLWISAFSRRTGTIGV